MLGKYPEPDPFGGTPGDFTGALVKDAVLKGLVHECVAASIKEDVGKGRYLLQKTTYSTTTSGSDRQPSSVTLADEQVPAEHVSVFVADAIREYLELSPIVVPKEGSDGEDRTMYNTTQKELLEIQQVQEEPAMTKLGLQVEYDSARNTVEDSLAALLVDSLSKAQYPKDPTPKPLPPLKDVLRPATTTNGDDTKVVSVPEESSATGPKRAGEPSAEQPVAALSREELIADVLLKVRSELLSPFHASQNLEREEESSRSAIASDQAEARVDLYDSLRKERLGIEEGEKKKKDEEEKTDETTISVASPDLPSSSHSVSETPGGESQVKKPTPINDVATPAGEEKKKTSEDDAAKAKPEVVPNKSEASPIAKETSQQQGQQSTDPPTKASTDTIKTDSSSPKNAAAKTQPPSPDRKDDGEVKEEITVEQENVVKAGCSAPFSLPSEKVALLLSSEAEGRWIVREEEGRDRVEVRSSQLADFGRVERAKMQHDFKLAQEEFNQRQILALKQQSEQHQQMLATAKQEILQQQQQQVTALKAEQQMKPAALPSSAPNQNQPQGATTTSAGKPDPAAQRIVDWAQKVEDEQAGLLRATAGGGRGNAVVTQGALELEPAGPVYRCVDDMLGCLDEDSTLPSSDTHLSSFDSRGGHRFIHYLPRKEEPRSEDTTLRTSTSGGTDTTMTTVTATSTNTSMTSIFSENELAEATRGLDEVDTKFAMIQYNRRGYIQPQSQQHQMVLERERLIQQQRQVMEEQQRQLKKQQEETAAMGAQLRGQAAGYIQPTSAATPAAPPVSGVSAPLDAQGGAVATQVTPSQVAAGAPGGIVNGPTTTGYPPLAPQPKPSTMLTAGTLSAAPVGGAVVVSSTTGLSGPITTQPQPPNVGGATGKPFQTGGTSAAATVSGPVNIIPATSTTTTTTTPTPLNPSAMVPNPATSIPISSSSPTIGGVGAGSTAGRSELPPDTATSQVHPLGASIRMSSSMSNPSGPLAMNTSAAAAVNVGQQNPAASIAATTTPSALASATIGPTLSSSAVRPAGPFGVSSGVTPAAAPVTPTAAVHSQVQPVASNAGAPSPALPKAPMSAGITAPAVGVSGASMAMGPASAAITVASSQPTSGIAPMGGNAPHPATTAKIPHVSGGVQAAPAPTSHPVAAVPAAGSAPTPSPGAKGPLTTSGVAASSSNAPTPTPKPAAAALPKTETEEDDGAYNIF